MGKEHAFNRGRTTSGSGNWRTPPAVLADLSAIAGWEPWGLDLSATDRDRVCDDFVGPGHPSLVRRDALAAPPWLVRQWAAGRPVWCNPPYDQWAAFAGLLNAAAATEGVRGCLLIFARTDAAAWHRVAPCASALAFRGGRISFLDPNTGEVGGGAPAPSVALFFGGGGPWTGRRGRVQGDAAWHVVTP